jgi:hypothetical protein
MHLPDPPAFRGWYRPNRLHPWRLVVTGPCEDEIWCLLLTSALAGDKTVTQGTADPNRSDRSTSAGTTRMAT